MTRLEIKFLCSEQRRIAVILSAAGREEEYPDRRKIMKASVSWNKYVTYGTMSILWSFMGLKSMAKSHNILVKCG
ncbi:MAG: hypothetical protein Q8P40_11260 [Nitrospirota bacterium]|nr:hypothetical protein [Nitrospirota bacterium]